MAEEEKIKNNRQGNGNRTSSGKTGHFESPKREGRSPRVKQMISSGFTVFTNKRNSESNGNGREDSNPLKHKKEKNHSLQKNVRHNQTNPQVGQPAFKEPKAQAAEVDEINVGALRRLDPAFKELFGTSSQVAIYDFDTETKNWKQSDCAGCFFLYARKDTPRYGFVVMNRLNLDNFIQTFDLDTEVQSLPPYILLKHKSAISCLWFYSAEECTRFSVIMDINMGLTFTAEDGTPKHNTSKVNEMQPAAAPSANMSLGSNGQNLLSMLVSGLRTEGSEEAVGGFGSEPQTPQQKKAAEPKRKSVFTLMELEQELIAQAPPAQPVASPKSGRMQTVEQLERDMRSQEMQDENAKELEEDLRRKLGIGSNSRAGSDSSNVNIGFSNEGSRKQSAADSMTSSLRGSNELSAKSPFLTPMTPQSRSSDSRRSDRAMTADDLVGLPLSESDIDVVREVFQNGTGRDLCLIPIDTPERKQCLHWTKTRQAIVNSQMANAAQSQYHDFSVSPLTKEQLQQGFIHLLTTDPSFVVKLHEAYVASLNSSLRKN